MLPALAGYASCTASEHVRPRVRPCSNVVDAIYEEVDYLEPWMGGNLRGPSTAFCLLYRLCQLKPSENEVEATITHTDSVYIRAVSRAAVCVRDFFGGEAVGQKLQQ